MAGKRDKSTRLSTPGVSESLIAALKRELEGETAPEGWYTVSQIANMLGISFEAAGRLGKRKRWESKQYTTVTTDNKRLLVRHYKMQ
jgi:hypothetical protein